MHDVLTRAREQNVSTGEVVSRLNELREEFVDKYQRLALSTYKRQHLKL